MAVAAELLNAKVLVSTEGMDREDWLKWRNKGIGGSDASVICGVNKYKSPVELWMEKTGQIESKEAGEAAYWGNVLEPIVREEFTKRSGLDVMIEKSILQHPDHYFMLANLDGIVNDPQHGTCVFEAKTASIYNTQDWELSVPEHYQLQVQHYLAVTGFNGAYIAVLIGGNQFKYYFIERDEEIIDLLIQLESRFGDCVIYNRPPKIDGSKACTELLNRLYPTGKHKDTVDLPYDAEVLIKQYEEFQAAQNDAERQKNEAANMLKKMLGDYEHGLVGSRTVSWTNINSEKLDSKLLKSEQPDIYAKYSVKSSYRRFSIK